MVTDVASPLITAEEMLALPDNGVEREVIEGHLRESAMTRRSRRHSRTTTNAAMILKRWRSSLSRNRGEVLTGDAGFCLKRNPDTTVGVDIAYVSAELAAQTPDDVYLINGAPVLAAEILSPTDTHERIVEKIRLLLDSGVQVVWIIDPDLQTVMVHRPGAAPTLFTASEELPGDPELPGLRIGVAELFES